VRVGLLPVAILAVAILALLFGRRLYIPPQLRDPGADRDLGRADRALAAGRGAKRGVVTRCSRGGAQDQQWQETEQQDEASHA
jgi:hypothetical protein